VLLLSEIEEERERWRSEVDSVLDKISDVEAEINKFLSLLATLDSYSIEIPSSLKEIRSRGYVFHASLEDRARELIDSWMKLRHSFVSLAKSLETNYLPRLKNLRIKCERLLDLSPSMQHEMELRRIEDSVRNLEHSIDDMLEKVWSQARELESRFFSIKSRINMALWCTSLLMEASFKLFDDEHVVSAYSAKLMGEDKIKGYLFVTDKRLIFEAEKEIVLKKVLFIATKKKKVREIVYDIPIGYVAQVSKGKVGFFERGGVYIDFKPYAPVQQLVFDLSDRVIDNLIRDINYVLSGMADRDRVEVTERPAEKQAPAMVKCPYCGAPIKKEIVRGLTSIKCEYCGAVIQLS